MDTLFDRLTSRALWVTIATAIVLIVNDQWTELTALAIGYISGNALPKVAANIKQPTTEVLPIDTPEQHTDV